MIPSPPPRPEPQWEGGTTRREWVLFIVAVVSVLAIVALVIGAWGDGNPTYPRPVTVNGVHCIESLRGDITCDWGR